MDWALPGIVIMIVLSTFVLTHYNGYKLGRKDGFELGKEKINEYALKVNKAQDERIKELEGEKQARKMTDIDKIASFLTKDIKN